MNKYDRERVNMLIVMLMYITGLSERIISPYVKRTKTYLDILNGEELTLYDSYAANLVDMASEWRRKTSVPPALRNVTVEQINNSNSWLREQEIRNSRQAKLFLSKKQKFKQLPQGQESSIAAVTLRGPQLLKFRIANRFQKAPITTEEPLYKDM